MKLSSNNTTEDELNNVRFALFKYWREGAKLKDIIQDNKTWTEVFISDQLKIVMDSWFSGSKYYAGGGENE